MRDAIKYYLKFIRSDTIMIYHLFVIELKNTYFNIIMYKTYSLYLNNDTKIIDVTACKLEKLLLLYVVIRV